MSTDDRIMKLLRKFLKRYRNISKVELDVLLRDWKGSESLSRLKSEFGTDKEISDLDGLGSCMVKFMRLTKPLILKDHPDWDNRAVLLELRERWLKRSQSGR